MKKNQSNISYKELLLLGILLLLLAFYAVDRGPLQNKVDELNGQINDIQTQINAVTPYIDQMDRWNKELDKIFADANGSPVSIPDYDNINNLLEELSEIFDPDDSSYVITFGNPSVSDSIASRELSISYTSRNYTSTIEKLEELDESDTRFRIKNIVVNKSTDGSYNVNVNLVVFEYAGDNN